MNTTTRHPTRPAANWREAAACARVDSELFFPVGDNAEARQQADNAKRVCARCPVKEACLEWALETGQDVGVLGGMTEQERHLIHGRGGAGEWARRRDVAAHLYATRWDEFRELVGQELKLAQIAGAMGTNVQTVNRLLERLAAEETVQGVKAA